MLILLEVRSNSGIVKHGRFQSEFNRGSASSNPGRLDYRTNTRLVLSPQVRSILPEKMAKNFSYRRWADKAYNPDMVSKSETLYKKPGYTT
jgi:hypothetical protein